MGESTHKVLFVNSEIYPFLPESDVASFGRNLPQGIQDLRNEIRLFMPRYGCINERKNQLHEVIRLSGMNIIISDMDRPLIIKVASVAAARMQVYFIDNEDYFRRKGIYCDSDGKFFEDNDERAIFFARGVLETVKKLRWAPDIIHCQGWLSQLLPAYLKKAYIDDPIFSQSKVVVSLFGDTPKDAFSRHFVDKVVMGGLTEEDLPHLAQADGINLAKTAVQYSDGVVAAAANAPQAAIDYAAECGIPVLKFNAKSLENGNYIKEYNDFYDKL